MFTIAPARTGEWRAAFELALQHVPADVRHVRVANALALAAAGEIVPEGIFVARDANGLAGAQVCIPLVGANGLLWPPQARADVDPILVDGLVQTALAWLRSRGAKLAQALVSASDWPFIAPLLRCGFIHLTRLLYLKHDLVDVPTAAPSPLRFEPYQPANEEAFQATLERSYEGTLDCPELNGRRTIREIIAGHQAQGRFRPERWTLAWREDRPVGVSVLTEMFDDLGWDLSYVGVVPEARRQGAGQALTLRAIRQACQDSAERLLVAVDARNYPARRLYAELGFAEVEEREVLLYFF